MKIAFITNIPSPYRVDFFNEWGKYCDLTVFFEKNQSDERDKSWTNNSFCNFKPVFLSGIKSDVDKALSFEICKYLKKNAFDKIIVSNMATPTGIVAIIYMKMKKIRYWIEGDGGFAKDGKGFKEKFKRFLLKGADGCFSTSRAHDEYYKTYGVAAAKIHRYPFTALHERDIRNTPCDFEEKKRIRQRLGISEDRYIITVGQFIHRKGFDVLLYAASKLPKDVGVYFVGGIPTDEYIRIKNEFGLDNVHFVSFTDKETLKQWYAGAELMVLPTREDIWGLVINEAMAAGIPIVTTDRCIAGLELVNNEENGYVIPSDNVDLLAKKINQILGNNQLQHSMSENSLIRIQPYTIENMVKTHLQILTKG